MGNNDPRHDVYIAQAPAFAVPILEKLRKAYHRACPDVVETMKWSSPHFEKDGLLGGMAFFKKHVSFHLWNGKELEDPEGLFKAVGKSQMAAVKVSSVKDLPTQKVLVEYIKRAARYNAENAAAPAAVRKKKAAAKRKPPPRPPADLVAALKKNAKARKTFEAFPPGAQRDYVVWITEAKRDATRATRLATTVEWLAEGKRRNWKYENC